MFLAVSEQFAQVEFIVGVEITPRQSEIDSPKEMFVPVMSWIMECGCTHF